MVIRLLSLAACLFASLTAYGQTNVTIDSAPIRHVTRCLNQAIQKQNLTKHGQEITFRCHGDIAKQFYDFLQYKGTSFADIEKTGSVRIRAFNNEPKGNMCIQVIEDAQGHGVTGDYRCMIYMPLGPFINE